MNSSSVKTSEEQLLASTKYLDKHLMIIAAPGSGKTFTMMNRILTLLNKGVKPSQIMATTFTKKAANDLQTRLHSNLPPNYLLAGMRIGTIHSCAMKIIRAHAGKLGLNWNFKLIDKYEQAEVLESSLSEYLQEFELEDLINSGIQPVASENLKDIKGKLRNSSISLTDKQFSYINSVICSGKIEKTVLQNFNFYFFWVFDNYNKKLKQNKFIDFADILYLAVDLFNRYPLILEKYQKEIKYLLVDEFQDTNSKQLEFLLMAGGKAFFTVCGDDDQAIYSWRGACGNIFETFKSTFPESETLYLHTNYRSSKEILSISMQLISNNKNRLDKEIGSKENSEGDCPEVIISDSPSEEAKNICKAIKHYVSLGFQYKQIAVVYRVKHVIKELLPELRSNKIPVKSPQRTLFLNPEESAVFSYLKLLMNLHDQEAFLAICNFPKRKFGEAAQKKLSYISTHKKCSLYDALCHIVSTQKSPLPCFKDFHALLDSLLLQISTESVESFVLSLIQRLKLRTCQTIEKLVRGLDSKGRASFESFLSLLEGEDTTNKLNLCTIHSAKGQEWEIVFIARLNEKVLPGSAEMAEERRLAYVAVTRAKQILILSCVYSLKLYQFPSRFIEELFPPLKKVKNSSPERSKHIKYN